MEVEVIVSKFKLEIGEDYPPQDVLLEYMEQIKNIFSGNVEMSKLDNYLGLIFPETPNEGLLGFLRKKLGEKFYEKAKEQIFQLIQFLFMQKKWKADVTRFCIRFKNAADMYWKNRKENARLQQAALDCLITLYDNFGTTIDLEEFDTAPLYWELLKRSEQSVHQPTVRAKMFHLMGILSSLGRNAFMAKDGCFKQLFNHYTTTVKSQVESTDAHLEVSILLGCMNGMDAMLRAFGTIIEADNASWIKFQDHLEQIVDPTCSIVKGDGKAKLKRREFQRAALQLVADHGTLLESGLFRKYKQWYEDLIAWSKSTNADDQRVGRKAMYKFLETVFGYSKSMMDDDGDSKALRSEMFSFFSGKFKSVLAVKDPNKTELGIAVRGFGMLSGICEEPEQTQEMFDLIMQHINSIIIELDSTTIDKYNSSLITVPTYLEAVASIIPSLNTAVGIPEQQFDSIKKLAVLLIRLYPDLSEGYRRYCHISVQKVIDSLWHHHHPLCEPFTDQVYQQSLLHIISSRTRAEVDILIESYNKTNPNSKKSALSQLGLKPVTSYVQFWRQLLGSGVSASGTLRFDLLMKWLLSTVGKLDLSINFEEKEEDSLSALDPVQGATANVVKDFQIFVNLVDFFQELMTEKSLHRHFEKWVDVFSIDILGHIKAHAYVSGFYKILAVVFDSARTLDYFEQLKGERNSLLKRLNIFFKVLGTKIREFRDDLLFSVLELWLSLPDVLILTNFTALNQTLQTVFTTGRNSFSLALRGLEAIERWFFKPKFPVNEIETIMNNLFPILKTYFLHSELVDNELSKKSTPEPSKNGLKSLVKKNVQVVNVDEDPTLKEIQLKILKLIGYFGNFVRLEEKQHQGLATDRQFLSYAVPFQDCKPELYLDDLLHRVLELCENAVNRQTRVSACEFFHTVALIFIGRSREGGKLGLFKQIFHSMLRLGCDSDICVRQLFNPLCLQAIHWFSKPSSPYGEILLQILTENLSQHEDPNLREFTAVCIGEYFAWSLKHSQSSQNPKATGILKTICAMSTHASSDFRQGSVLAFNSIYRDFREDSHLVNEFSFDLLSSFLTSLQLSKELPEDSLLVTNTKQSIGHLERIFIKKKTIFNTALRRRFKPKANAGSTHTLANVVEWLVSHGGSTAKVFREECLRLTSILAPCVRDKGSTEAYLIGVEEERGLENWISIAEGSASIGNEIQDQLNFLEASSDFYNFLFDNGVLKKTVFTNPKSVFCKTLLGLNTDIEGEERFSDEQIPGLLRMFSQLKFAWELLDSESLNILWECSMELSKNHLSNHTPGLLADLVEVWTFRAPSRKMKTLCHSLFTFEPHDLMQSDDKFAALRQVQWYRAVAEGGLFTSILNQTDLEEIKDKLWASILSSLYKQTSTSTGQIWETHNLDHNSRKIIESYLVIALCSGLDHATVVDATFDATNLTHHDGTFRLTATKGQIFQKVLMDALIYCDKLFEFDALVQQKPIKDVGEFTQRMLALLKSDRKLKRRFGKTVFDKTMKNWTMISNNCDVPTTVKIFAGLLAVDANACRNSLELSSWWNGKYLMNATHLDLKQKAEVFGYASVFTSSSNSRIVDDILKTISKLVSDLKPEESPWTEVEPHVTHIFRRVLSVFEQLPRSFCLLNPILWMLQKVSTWAKNDTNHALFRLARESLEKAVKDLYTTDSDRLKMASDLYKLITATEGKLLAETTPVWKFSLLPVVASLRQPAAEKFFLNHIYDIVAKTDIKATNIYEWNLKTFAIHLLELLVYQTTEDFIKGEKLGAAYFDSIPQNKREKQDQAQEKNKLVYKNMCRVCIAGLTATTASVSSQDTVSQSCSLNYRIACYNTLAATLLVMKAEIKFINKFLFPGVRVFENIVDANANYDFPIVIDEDRHKEGIVDHRKNPNSTESSVTDALKFFRASGNLTGSSLAPEATSYDFTTSVTVANSEYYQRIFGESKGGGKSKTGQGQSTRAKLEWSEINEHGCMVAYVEILKQMGELHRLNPECEQNWVTTLVNILTNSAHHNNVKVFIVGGIVNAPTCLEPFAGKLIDPIIKLIVTDCFGSVKFNHFVQDVLITLLSWSKTAKPENVSISGILDYMLESIKCDEVFGRKDILNHALELLQNIVKHWASDLSVMPETSISSLSDETLMLQVSLSILRGGQLPQKETNPNTLMKKFLTACTHRLKGMYYTGAKCVGVLLSQIKQNASQADTQLYIQATTKKLLVLSKGKPAVFVEIISAIQQSFPEIILHVKDAILELMQRPKIRSEIFVLLPQLFKEMLGAISLDDNEMKTLPQDCASEFLIDIVGRGVFQQFCSSEGEMYAALELLELFIDSISDYSKLLKIVDWVQCAESSSNKEIRLRYAKVLLRLYEKLLTDDAGTLDLSTKNIFLKTFVRMYGDEDSSTHAVVNQFWSTVLRDWKQSSDLLVELFDLMDQNENALHVCLGLILQRCSLSPDYSKHIFPEPLEECHFIPFELDTSWRLRHSSFQPLFAESLSTAQNFSILPRAIQSSVLSQKRSVGKFGMNVLRATLANLQFTPTQQGGNDPESLMEVDDSVAYPNFDFSMPIPNSENNTNEENNVPENPVLKLRKKFYASKDSAFYATKTTEKRVDRVEAARDLERSRISGVKTVRSYRIGELPDILIHHSDLLNTLLKLTKHDQLVGHQFLVYLYSGMTKEMDRSARRKLIHKSTEIFNRVLRNSLFLADRSLASIIVEVSIFNTIPIQSALVLEVSKSTNLQKLGILKLEEELLNETAESSHSNSKRAKVQCGTNSHEEDVWLGIADMYREMDEYDVLRNIFTFAQDKSLDSERKILYGKVGNALHLEGQGHLESAVVVFDEWVHGESEGTIEYTETMKTFLEDAMMQCLTKLTDWEALYKLTGNLNTAISEDLFQNRNTVERLIPVQMKSGMQLVLRNEDEDEAGNSYSQFQAFMQSSLESEEGTAHLTSGYPFDVGAWLLVQDEDEYFPQAHLLLERGNEALIRKFKIVDSLPLKTQKYIMVSLQQASVLCDFLGWRKQAQSTELTVKEVQTRQLLQNWRKGFDHKPLDLLGSDVIAAYRDRFISKIGITLESSGSQEEMLLAVQNFRVEKDLWLANLGVLHKNYAVSHFSLERLKSSGRGKLNPTEFYKAFARFLTTFHEILERGDWCKRWCNVYKKISKIHADNDIFNIRADLFLCVLEAAPKCGEADPAFSSIMKTLNGDVSSTLDASVLRNALELIKASDVQESSCSSSLYSKLFHLLKKLSSKFPLNDEITLKMLRCLLRGCVEGSSSDMLKLSNIFSLLKKSPSLIPSFGEMMKNVPSYLFLPWIDQIVTTFRSDQQLYAVFRTLIDRLVLDYPQAFQLQYPEFLNSNYQLFADAMKAIVWPSRYHADMIENICKSKTEGQLVEKLTAFQDKLRSILNSSNKIYGKTHMDYAKEMLHNVHDGLAKYQKSSQNGDSQGSGIGDNLLQIVSKIQKTQDNNRKRESTQVSKLVNLNSLSPFLEEFHFFEYEPIEKPGLYSDFRRVRVEDHPHIVSFHPTVLPFASVTQPLRVTFVCNNGKRSNILAKLGDDLRQDRRIQQLFKVSNVLLQDDTSIVHRNIQIVTYSCIPITADFGVIDMVDNVMSLSEMIFDTPELKAKRTETRNFYEQWVSQKSGVNSKGLTRYKFSANKVNREQAERFFTDISTKLPENLLRGNLKRRAKNLQDFFTIRQDIIKSYGALCMVHWLLGIGDRHLENSLFSMTSGKIVGIDFGRAFGTSNSIIPIPEMVPFRLTPQLQQLMMPYSFKGLFRELCILTWKCLKDSSETLLTVADVFIQEPSMDWLKIRQRPSSNQGEDVQTPSTRNETTWAPIEIMARKLHGHNPTHLLQEELKVQSKEIAAAYSKIAQDGRIHVEKDEVSIEEYVDVLLDLATDKNVLSRLYSGWNSWV